MLKYIRVYQKKFSLPWFSSCFGGVSLLAWYCESPSAASGHVLNPVIPTLVLSSQPLAGDGSSEEAVDCSRVRVQDWSPVAWTPKPAIWPSLGSRITGPTPIAGSAWFQLWVERCSQAGCSPLKQSGKRKFPRRAGWSLELLWSTSSMPEIVSSSGHFFLLGAKCKWLKMKTLGITRSFTHSSRISRGL